MRRINVSAYIGPLFLSIFLLVSASSGHTLYAQTTAASTGGPFISCSTSGGAGIDIYLTGVFQTTRPVRHVPSGGNLVDQSVLDDFYAYLKQKGYNFKPGSNYGCDVSPTEAAAKAAQHKRAYEGGACSNCGKIVETGWKDSN